MKDLSMFTCYFNPSRRTESRYNILHPVTISIAGSTPENKGLHVEVQFCIADALQSISIKNYISAVGYYHTLMCFTCNHRTLE